MQGEGWKNLTGKGRDIFMEKNWNQDEKYGPVLVRDS